MVPAPLWRRLAAWLLDLLVLHLLGGAILAAVLLTVFSRLPLGIMELLGLLAGVLLLLLLMPPLLAITYFTLWHSCGGQTLGKMALGIMVVGPDQAPPSPGLALLRGIGQLLSLLPLAAGFLWAFTNRERRTWYDHLALTRVVLV